MPRARSRPPSPAAPDRNGVLASPPRRLGVGALVARRLRGVADWEQLSPTELARFVGADPGLAARAMTAANLPLYGLARRIATLSHAVSSSSM